MDQPRKYNYEARVVLRSKIQTLPWGGVTLRAGALFDLGKLLFRFT